MIDLETLDNVPSGVVMSLGAVKFDIDSDKIDDNAFYASISIESNLDLGRTISESTINWWMQQEPKARAVFQEKKISLATALMDFRGWMNDGVDYKMWGNGADFDQPFLQSAYRQLKQEAPWKFWNNRCFRTFKNLPHAHKAKFMPSGVKHNALHDAMNQAKHAQAIQKVLKGLK